MRQSRKWLTIAAAVAVLTLVITVSAWAAEKNPAPSATNQQPQPATPAAEQTAVAAPASPADSATPEQPPAPDAIATAPAAQTQQPPAQPPAAGQQVQQVTEPTAETAPLRVMVGKSILINTAERLKRVSVTDPNIADALVVTPTQVLVHGRAPGEVTLVLWDEQERSRSFDLRVDVDVSSAAEEIKGLFPGEEIHVTPSRAAIVLSGHVTDKDTADHAAAVASAYSKNVINVLTFGPQGAQEVLLEVKFAEVDRTALLQMGLNILSTGAAGNVGQTSTQQFGGHYTDNTVSGVIGAPLTGTTSTFKPDDLLNVFLFRPDLNLGVIIKDLAQKNVLQILAEPNLIAINGKEASFLAGGEFPYPVVQPTGTTTTVTITFKEFGVRLRFTPIIQPNGNIRLAVKPEVSSLDYTNATTVAGYLLPAISTRRAETEFELQDGQSFVIAGLMDNRVTNVASKMPGLGDLPIIGYLFRSKNLQKTKSELMVLVTAHKVAPTAAPGELPKNPQPFLDPNKFDKKAPYPAGGAK